VRNDRLNALVKYTYFYNVPTTDQLGLQNTATEFLQKSHIAALDLTYDLTANWSVGGKYAYRLGEASLEPRAADFLRQYRAAHRVALGLAVPQAMGHPGRGPTAWPSDINHAAAAS